MKEKIEINGDENEGRMIGMEEKWKLIDRKRIERRRIVGLRENEKREDSLNMRGKNEIGKVLDKEIINKKEERKKVNEIDRIESINEIEKWMKNGEIE